MMNLKDDSLFMRLWEKKRQYQEAWLHHPYKYYELCMGVNEFTFHCMHIIDRSLENALTDDSKPSTLIGNRESARCMFSCCMGELPDDPTSCIRGGGALEDSKYKYESIFRDERGRYSILFICTGQAFVGAACREGDGSSTSTMVQNIMKGYFDKMTDDKKCLMKLSGLDGIKEVFDL